MSDLDTSWLDALPAVAHGGVPADVLAQNPKFQALVEAFSELTPRQRIFVRALPAAHYVPAVAMRTLQAAGVKGVSERTIYRWNTEPAVRRAIDLYRALAGEFAGIDALSVMLRVSAWADYCMQEVEVKDDKGVVIDKKRRDPANGLKALELLGKHTRAIGGDSEQGNVKQLPAFIVGVNIATREPVDVIDVTAIEVKK